MEKKNQLTLLLSSSEWDKMLLWIYTGLNHLLKLHWVCIVRCTVQKSLSSNPTLWNESYSVMVNSLWPYELYSPWNSPGQNTGVGSFSLLQGIFPAQGSNPGLLHCRWTLYQLSHTGSPRILGWVAYPFSRGSSQPRNQTGVSCIASRFFTQWAKLSNLVLLAMKWFSFHTLLKAPSLIKLKA